MDHAGDLGTAGRVRDERGLDRVDAGGHRKRRAHVVVPQDPNARGHRAGASRADVLGSTRPGLAAPTARASVTPWHISIRSRWSGTSPATGTSSTTTFRNPASPR